MFGERLPNAADNPPLRLHWPPGKAYDLPAAAVAFFNADPAASAGEETLRLDRGVYVREPAR